MTIKKEPNCKVGKMGVFSKKRELKGKFKRNVQIGKRRRKEYENLQKGRPHLAESSEVTIPILLRKENKDRRRNIDSKTSVDGESINIIIIERSGERLADGLLLCCLAAGFHLGVWDEWLRQNLPHLVHRIQTLFVILLVG